MARRRIPLPPPIDASEALHLIMADGDVFLVGRQRYLVAPITQDTLDALIVANSLAEDDEENGDLEPSLGTEDDLEGDGLDRGEHDGHRDDEPSCQSADMFLSVPL